MSRTYRNPTMHWIRHPKHQGSRRAASAITEDEYEAGMSLGKIHQPPDDWEDQPIAARREKPRRRI